MKKILARRPFLATFLGVGLIMVGVGSHFWSVARAQEDVTPGMLFGPLWVDQGQHIELCSSFLSDGGLTQFVHFRNLTTGEVTQPVMMALSSGGGACASYSGRGNVVGLARGEGEGADWVSPSNALIGTMSVIDNGRGARVTVLGVAKFWLRGL
jgi:hypothetical protein